jgi:hypothetical protein
MKPELQYLKDEMEETLNEVYRLGFEKGAQPNKAILDDKKNLLYHFDAHLLRFRRFQDDNYGERFYLKEKDRENAITLGTLITNFLLSYDDE